MIIKIFISVIIMGGLVAALWGIPGTGSAMILVAAFLAAWIAIPKRAHR